MREYLALLCDPKSRRIVEVIHRPAGLDPQIGAPLDDLFEPGSQSKLQALHRKIDRDDYAIDWEMLLVIDRTPTPYHFAGARVGARNLILGSVLETDLLSVADELARLHNEQTNRLREALKELSNRRAPPDNDLYTEMSQLNNELTTLQRELARRNARLEQLNREKNELLGMASHDLRNPMAAMLGLSEHLLREAQTTLAPRHIAMLEHLRSSSEHMLALVEDLLSLTSIESGTLRLSIEATDLTALIRRAAAIAQELAADKGITVDLRGAALREPCVVDLDPHKITQALGNLLTNAVKFSHPAGRIVVRFDVVGGQARISVEDRGVGIPKEHLGDLFKPFRAGRPGTRGEKTTGLGLAIVQRIIRGHGGEIELTSELNVGTTFALTLPLRPSDPVEERSSASTLVDLASLRILIADDDPISRLVLRTHLEEQAHEVVAAADTDAAIDALADRRFDLVIVDVEMPGGGGLAVSRALRRHPNQTWSTTPIIALTAHAGEQAALLARGPGLDAVLSKPLRVPELEALLAKLAPTGDA